MADFLTLSPEVNSANVRGWGPGRYRPAAAWDELAAELWFGGGLVQSVVLRPGGLVGGRAVVG